MTITAGPAPEGTENLGIVRCNQGGFDSDGCISLVHEDACKVGGDVVYGLHWENGYRTMALVGTIGVAPAAEHAPR